VRRLSPQDGVTVPFSLWRTQGQSDQTLQLHAFFRLQTAPSLGKSGKVLQIISKAVVRVAS